MGRIAAVSIVVAVALVPVARAAQPAKAKPAAGAPATELAKTLVTEKAWTQMLDSFTQSLTRQIEAGLTQQGSTPPEGLQAKVRTELGNALPWTEGIDLQAQALTQRFTPDELRNILGFYRSPQGQKLLRELPELARSVDQQIQSRLQERVPKIVEKVAPSLAAKQQPGAGVSPAPGPGPGTTPVPGPASGAGGGEKGKTGTATPTMPGKP